MWAILLCLNMSYGLRLYRIGYRLVIVTKELSTYPLSALTTTSKKYLTANVLSYFHCVYHFEMWFFLLFFFFYVLQNHGGGWMVVEMSRGLRNFALKFKTHTSYDKKKFEADVVFTKIEISNEWNITGARQYLSDTLVFDFPSTIEWRNSFNRIA